MASKIPKTNNKVLFDTIRDLKKVSEKSENKVWKAVTDKMSTIASQRPEVNLTRLEKNAKDKETIVVPGKILGMGTLTKKLTVVGFKASESAIKKIEAAGGSFIEIRDYISKNPKNKPRILG